MIVTNRAKEPVAFRDDAGKHVLKRSESLEVQGDQHLAHILSLPGIQAGGEVPADLAEAAEKGEAEG